MAIVFILIVLSVSKLNANPIPDSSASISIGRSLYNQLALLPGKDANVFVDNLSTLCSNGTPANDLTIHVVDAFYNSNGWKKPQCSLNEAPTFDDCIKIHGGSHVERWEDFNYRSKFLCLFVSQKNQSFFDRIDFVLSNSPYYEQIKDAIQNFFIRCATSQFIWFPQMEKEFNVGRSIVYLFFITVGGLMACICSLSLLTFGIQLFVGEVSITLILLFTNDVLFDYLSTHLICLIFRYILMLRFFLLHCRIRPNFTKFWQKPKLIPNRKRKAAEPFIPDEVAQQPSPNKNAPRRSARLSRT